MKKIYNLFFVLLIASALQAQEAFKQNFNGFTNGNLGTQGGAVQNGSGTDVQVASASPLTYPGYQGGGQYITVSAVNGTDPEGPFINNIPTNTSQVIYTSFLFRATAAQLTTTGTAYSISIQGSNLDLFRFYVGRDAGNNVKFGVGVGTDAPSFGTATYAFGTTYLILIRYNVDIGAGSNGRDDAYLFVNPSLTTEPATNTASASSVNSTAELNYGNTATSLNLFQLSTNSPDAAFDAFRVTYGATSTAAFNNLTVAILPVTLESFNASIDAGSVQLTWKTSNEIGLNRYEVERSNDGISFQYMGSVTASHANTYSFTDHKITGEDYYYRIKMIDLDGTYKLSHIVSIKGQLNVDIKTVPNPVRNNLLVYHPKASGDGTLEIRDAKGLLMKYNKIPVNTVATSVDMSSLSSGLYYVTYKAGNVMISKRIVKQ